MKVSFNNNTTKKRNAAKLIAVLLVSLMMLASVFTAAIFAGFKVPAAQGNEGNTAPVWNGSMATGFHGGNGSEGTPYEISTGAELSFLASVINNNMNDSVNGSSFNSVAKFYKLTNDIVLNNTEKWTEWGGSEAGEENAPANTWTEIGYYAAGFPNDFSKTFQANFDGSGFSVKGVFINKLGTADSSDSFQGLFGYVRGGSVKNLGVNQSYIKGYRYVGGITGFSTGTITNCYNTGTVSGSNYFVGGIAGYIYNSSITNCYNTGVVSGSTDIGGIAGFIDGGSLTNSYNTGTVSGSSDGVGGVAGLVNASGSITNSYNTGKVFGSGYYVGGVAGKVGGSITNSYNTGEVSGSSNYVGGVAGIVEGSVTNCYNTGAVSGSSDGVGGVAGIVNISGSVTNCYNTGAVSGTGTNIDDGVGGVAGGVYSGSMTNSYNTGTVTGGGSNVGGVAGYVGSVGSVSNCYYLTGKITVGTVLQTEANEKAVGSNSGTAGTAVFSSSGIITANNGITNITITPNTTTLLDALNAWVNLPANSGGGYKPWWGKVFPQLLLGFMRGDGLSAATAYEISIAAELAFLAREVNAGNATYNLNTVFYKLTNDIILNDTSRWTEWGGSEAGEENAPANEWTPIGKNATNCMFAANFDGRGYAVKGVYINKTGGNSDPNSWELGLFGVTIGTISNTGVEESYIYGYTNVGGIAGKNSGIISNCYNTGSLAGASGNFIAGIAANLGTGGSITNCYNAGAVSGSNYAGGIAGNVSNGTITNCYNAGAVKGGINVGGVVGYATKSTGTYNITNSYNTGKVSGGTNVGGVAGCVDAYNTTNCYNTGAVSGSVNRVGGVAGYISGSTIIANSYNTGAVSGGTNAGGVAGDVGTGTITNCYNTGAVLGSGSSIGCVAGNVGSSVTNCFYLYQTAVAAIGSGTGTATTAVFNSNGVITANSGISGITENSTTLLDALNAWVNLPANSGGGYKSWWGKIYPQLLLGFMRGDGTEQNPYEISTAAELAYLASVINNNTADTANGGLFNDSAKFYKLTNDIILNDTSRWTEWGGSEVGEENAPANEWTAIGTDASRFLANFDGQGYAVKGVYINKTGSTTADCYQGLFGYVNSGTISNVGVEKSFIKGYNNIGSVAGLVNTYGSIANCYNAGAVSGSSGVGGIAGYVFNSSVTNCYNTGAVSGSSSIGGVAGSAEGSASITNCYNSGTVSGEYNVGGVAGDVNTGGSITNSYNTGEISGSTEVGGIAGYVFNSSVTNCYNTGAVSGSSSIGGVAGSAEGSASITNCYNSGTVSGEYNVGGVAGDVNTGGSITNCYNTGTVSGRDYIGGVAGISGSSIINCYNSGAVSGGNNSSNIGGVAGIAYGAITNCYNSGAVSGSSYIGGVAGGAYNAITNCYNTGAVSGNDNVGGVAGWINNAITNCYNAGAVSGDDIIGGVAGWNNGTITNCYFLQTETINNGINATGSGTGTITTAVFNSNGVITAFTDGTSAITGVTVGDTLLTALNAWVSNNSGGGYKPWLSTPYPVFELDKAYEYTITGSSTTGYTVEGLCTNRNVYTLGSDYDLRAIISLIAADADGSDLTIRFGSGGTDVLDIGNFPLMLSSTSSGFSAFSATQNITLEGRIVAEVFPMAVIIDGVKVTSYAAIINTAINTATLYDPIGIAINNNGTLTVAGGSVQAATGYAIFNASTGTVTVSGGTVSSGGNTAIASSAGLVSISGDAEIFAASVHTDDPSLLHTLYAVVHIAEAAAGVVASSDIVLSVSGGTVYSTGDGSAIISNSAGIVNISGGQIYGSSGNMVVLNGTGTLNISAGTISSAGGSLASYNGAAVANNNAGTVNISGGTMSATTSAAAANMAVGTINISGGAISATVGFAVLNYATGSITVSGGTVSATNGNAVYNVSTGTINVSGGTVQATTGCAVYNVSTGAINISGGTVSATTGTAIYNASSGLVSISETDNAKPTLITSASTTAPDATIYLTNSSANVRLTITGGTISNTATGEYGRAINNMGSGKIELTGGTVQAATGRAIHNEAAGEVFIGGAATISSSNYAVYNGNTDGKLNLGGDPAISGKIRIAAEKITLVASGAVFAPSSSRMYSLELSGTMSAGLVAVKDGKNFASNFTITNTGYNLVVSGNDLVSALKTYAVTVPTTQTNYAISSNAATATHGTDYTFTVAAAAGYKITAVTYTIGSGSADTLSATSGSIFGTAGYTVAGANVTGAFSLSVTIASIFDGGSGTLVAPYLIATAEQLKNLSEIINAGNATYNASTVYYKLTANIALNNTTNWTTWSDTTAPTNTWIAIGYYSGSGTDYSKAFKANFDGNGKTVSGIYISNSNSNQGLFGYVYVGDIKNVGVVESYIKGGNQVGGIAGHLNGGAITNCYNTGAVSCTGNYPGGIVGYISYGTVANCYNTGTVTGGNSYIGGVAGGTGSNTCTIKNSYNTGAVLGTSVSSNYVGGIAGHIFDTGDSVINCYNTGSVTGAGSIGGIAGATYGSLTNCYNTGNVSGTGSFIGGVSGSVSGSGVTNCYFLQTATVNNGKNAIGSGGTTKSTAIFNENGIITQNGTAVSPNTADDITNITIAEGTTTLLEALNAWVNLTENSGGGFAVWYKTVFPVQDVYYQVTGLSGGTGYTVLGSEWARAGTGYSFTVQAATGYNITSVKYKIGSGSDTTLTAEGGVYTVPAASVTGNITITVVAALNTYTVSGTGAGTNYTVVGSTSATHGMAYTFTVTPGTGYNVSVSYTVGGGASQSLSPSSGTSYTIPALSVTGAIVISVSATLKTYTVTYSLNGGTGTKPSDITSVTHGATISTKPTEPASPNNWILSGYTHDGNWYTRTGTGTTGDLYVYNLFTFGTTTVTAATTLYLKWTAAAVNISTTSLTGGTYNTSYTASISASVASNAGGTLSYAVQTISGDGLPSGLTLNSSTGAITGTPSAAGSYTFTVRVTNAASGQYADKQLTIVVAKVTVSSITLPSASGITYGAALSTSTLSGGSSDGSFAWAAGTTIPTVSNSGYNVVFTPTDINNYDYSGITGWNGTAKTITQNVSITVTARDITVTPDSGISKTYGGTDPALTFTVTTGSLVPGDSLTGVLSRVVGENAGSYNILQGTLTSANNPNYNITFVAGGVTFTINTASVIKPSNGAAGLYYTAAVQSNNITTNAAYIIAASLTGGTNAAFRASSGTNAGTYYVKAVLNDKTNYKWEDGTTADIELTWSIAKAAVSSVTFPTSAGITYGAALSTSSLSGGSTALGSFAWENGTIVPTVSNSGYNVVFTPADLANYDFSGITGWDGTAKTITRTVQIAVSRIGITAAMFTVEAAEYTGGVLTPAVSLTAAGAGVTYSVGAYANNTNAGVGTASVQITGTGNYSGTITFYFTIFQKPVAVSAPSYSGGTLTYEDALPAITGATTGGTYALNAGQTLTAGTNDYNWTFTPADTGNFIYSGSTGTISLTVVKKAVTVAAPSYSGGTLTYGGSLPAITGATTGGTYALNAGQTLTAGTNDYNWTFTPTDTNNFEWSGLTGTISLTVLKAAGAGSVSMGDWTFGETEKNPVPVSSTNGTANVTYQYKTRGADDNTYTAVKPSTAGNYTVKATFAATDNYNSVSVTVNFTIFAAAITNPTEDPSEVVVEGQGGTKIDPDATLHLEDVSDTVLVSGIADGKEVLAVYDVFMLLEGAKIQPDGEIKITIKLTEEQLNATDLKLLVQNGDVWEEKEFILNDDGTISYYASNISTIAFTADALVGGDVNLAWLIVLLTIILVLEACFAALCFVLTRKNKKGATKTYSFAALPVFFAAISPAGALPVIIIELVAIIGLAVWIVLMFRQNPELAGQLKQTAKDAGGKTKEVVKSVAGKTKEVAKSVAGKTKSAFSAVRSKITKKKDKTQLAEKTDTCISATETAEETDTEACGDGDEEILLTIPEEELTQEDILEVETADSDDGDGQTETVNFEAEEKAAESGEVIIDDETKQILEEAAKEREAFVAAKKAGEKPEVPALRFTLSREDVIDRLEDMSSQSQNFPVEPIVVLKAKKHYCDTLRCGEWCFGLMYERKNVIKFTLRIDENFAAALAEKYTAFKKAAFPKGEGWYDLVIDSSFSGKSDVFEILDAAYAFVLARYYREENTVYLTDIEAAKEDAQTVVSEITENAAAPDPVLELAIKEREEALNKYRERNIIAFKMARKRILFYAAKNKELKDGTVKQPSKRHLPASLKAGGSTYALVYEKGYKEQDENGQEQIKIYVSLTVRIPDGYAAWLALRHPEVCRAHFPKNRNWYVVPVDGSFPNAQMVYRVLKRAKKFVAKN